jgi:hypothetical protein
VDRAQDIGLKTRALIVASKISNEDFATVTMRKIWPNGNTKNFDKKIRCRFREGYDKAALAFGNPKF